MWWPPAAEHFVFLGLRLCGKIVSLLVTGRIDCCIRNDRLTDALRRLANHLVGILYGSLKTRTLYEEATACGHRENLPPSFVAA
jgi:hypothetical protein